MVKSHLRLVGEEGEHLAEALLQEKGYDVLERNWRNRFGEIDLILTKDEIIVFVEVKSRTSKKFGEAREAITYAKKRRLGYLAESYVQENKLQDKFIRFDVVTVTWAQEAAEPEIEHLENVLFFDR